MNSKLVLLAISVAAISSCSTLYKSGQTPDDVYYSPTRNYGGDVRNEEQKDQVKSYNNENRTIRLGINDPRWRYLDNNYSSNLYINDYSYTPYNYGFNYGYYYNPFFWPYPVYSTVFVTTYRPKNTTPRVANLGGYNPVSNNSMYSKPGSVRPVRQYNSNSNGSAVGNVIRQIFTPANTNNNSNSTNNSSNNNRTYTPSNNSSSSSSSSGSSSSGSGGVSRPARSGRN